jgi:thiamine biosynthesis lipoprotein ApbE
MKILKLAILSSLLIIITSSSSSDSSQTYCYNYEDVLGTSCMIKLAARSESSATEAREAALAEIERLSAILNTYDPESEFSRWQKTMGYDIKVSPELFEVMSLFEKWQSATGGALNPATGSATELWKEADRTGILPAKEELSRAIEVMSKRHWILDSEKMTARHLTGDPLVFNSFVKSYIISKASDEIMKTYGIKSSILNIGGDLVVRGELEETIGVVDPVNPSDNNLPLLSVGIYDKAVATSGNYRQGFMVDDNWYSHILDPRTAMPAGEVISATVISENAVEAGALATAFNVLTPAECIELAGQRPGLEFLIVDRDGELYKSDGLAGIENASGGSLSDDADADYELIIEMELSRFEGRSLRPYVAIWVENENSEPVRTIALWYNNNRWLPDLRRWYAKNFSRTQDYGFMQTVTSATRSAGRYNLKWDMKDDSGKPVGPGKYTVYIEACRERGTYQLMNSELDLRKKILRVDMGGGVEVSSAVIEYKKADRGKDNI